MDRFETFAAGLTAPATDGAPALPSAAEDFAQVSRALWIGGAGDLDLVLADGARVVLAGVPGGILLPVRARALRGGTTATGVVALW